MTCLKYLLVVFLCHINPIKSSCKETVNSYLFSLNSDNVEGAGWTAQTISEGKFINATVPGGIYTDLRNAGEIGDIYFKDNDVQTRWVSKSDWIYRRTFYVTPSILGKHRVDLVAHGLDTVAHIIINGQNIGSSDNMFVRYKFDVKKFLKEGLNEISIHFDSPIVVANKLDKNESIPPACVPDLYHGECHANQLRKMQASFSWDWGPAFPSVGIWKPIYLESYNSAVIVDVITDTTHDKVDNVWRLSLTIYLDTVKVLEYLDAFLQAEIKLENGAKITTSINIKENTRSKGYLVKNINMTLSDAFVNTWWPNGYGDQPLYNLTVTFRSFIYPDEYFYKDIRVGFRTIELIQDSIDDGLTYYFKVNGLPIFMKGSNWIPGSVLPEIGYDDKLVDNVLKAAVDVHMNMLRVWGGGLYESDYFYDKCDQLGLLIWQDLMFACSMYPVNEKFLSSVSTEIEHNVRRLQHHASIALWAGNNENELALRGNWYGTGHNFSHYKDEYVKLYVDTIRPVVQKFDPTRVYVVSSPNNGKKSEEDGYVAENPGDGRYGDTHYYNYLEDLWSMDTYPKSRFCSEYGFQSLPSLATLKTATDSNDDLIMNSTFLNHRQHSPAGYGSIKLQIERQFGSIINTGDLNFTQKFIYYSQVIQAWAYKVETEFYRQSREDWMTMGALYWQLNDVWQAPTWSGLEFGGHWKMVHYYAKDFFAPILISPRLLPTRDITAHIINDEQKPILDAKLIIETFEWSSLIPINNVTLDVNEVMPLSAKKYSTNIVVPNNETRNMIFYRFSLKDKNSNMLSPYNYIFPAHLKNIVGYRTPNIKFTFLNVSSPSPVYQVKVKTDGVGLFVWLEIDREVGWLSENGFILSDETKIIQLHAKDPRRFPDIRNKLKLHLYDPRDFVKNYKSKSFKQ